MEILDIQKSFTKDKSKHNVKTQCDYCHGFLSPKISSLEDDPWNTILYESDNFVIVPSLGSIVEGWLLIVPKQHTLCIGALAEARLEELQIILDFTYNIVAKNYLEPTIFEHGPSDIGKNIGCGVDHAHLHVVPLQFNLLESAIHSPELHSYQWLHIDGLYDLRSLYSNRESYLYIKSPSSVANICQVSDIPCQSLRRVIARKLGIEPQYSYKKYSFIENVRATIANLKMAFDSIDNSLLK